MFAELHLDINFRKSSLLHLMGQPYCKKCRSAKVKDGIITYFLGTISLFTTEKVSQFMMPLMSIYINMFCLNEHKLHLNTTEILKQ
jgi:hypothetical protein